jgi:SulP family sulfate permease
MLLLAPLMGYVPMAALAALLLVVAWNISEFEGFRHTLSAPKGDRLVLLLTFGLTVFFDLTVAIEAGMVVAAFVLMARMADVVEVNAQARGDAFAEGDNGPEEDQREHLPEGVEVFQVRGPLFFGAASRLDEVFDQFRARKPRVFILRLRHVPIVDASGVHALRALVQRCRKQGVALVLSGVQAQPMRVFGQMGLLDDGPDLQLAPDYEAALALAARIVAQTVPA